MRVRPGNSVLAQVTKVGSKGATTFVVMFRQRRAWGFFRDGKWYEWRRFERQPILVDFVPGSEDADDYAPTFRPGSAFELA